MTKRFLIGLAMLAAVSSLYAADIALIYEGPDAVRQKRFVTGTVTEDGVVAPAQAAMNAGKNLLVGVPGQDLYAGSLSRLDNDLNLAVIRVKERVGDTDLQRIHRELSDRIKMFLPAASSAAVSGLSPVPLTPVLPGTAFLLRINGVVLSSSQTVTLPVSKLKKSKFKLEIVRPSSDPVWNVGFTLESDPKLQFWKEGREAGMNDVPAPVLKYSRQIMFRPLADGGFVTIPIEVYSIKQQDYVWTFNVWSKSEKMEQKVRIHFERRK